MEPEPSEISDVRVGPCRLRVYRYGRPISAHSELVLLVTEAPDCRANICARLMRDQHASGSWWSAMTNSAAALQVGPTDASLWMPAEPGVAASLL